MDSRTDVLGAVLLVCSASWALVAAAGRTARPEGVLLALLAVAAGYAAGRIGGSLLPVAGPGLTAAVVVALIVAVPGRPMSYVNADAALLVLATGAAGCAAWSARSRAVRLGLRLLAAGAAGLALAIGSVAAFAASVGVVLCSLGAGRARRGLGLGWLALATVVAVGGTYAMAVDAVPAGLSASLTGQLTPGRVALWRQAVEVAGRNPVRGVGPGQFAEAGAEADQADQADRTGRTDWTGPSDRAGRTDAVDAVSARLTAGTVGAEAPLRSAPLRLAAEEGVPGLVLLAAAYGWVLWALRRSPRPTPVVLTAGRP